MSTPFTLHPRLAADTLELGRHDGVLVLLMDDERWPWLILVPTEPDLVELDHLDAQRREALMGFAASLTALLRDITGAVKTNVATLGNMVPQFHLHVIARSEGDPAWPGPVWGQGEARPHADREAAVGLWRERLTGLLDA